MSPLIHWYPGHMAKAKRLLKEKLSLVDLAYVVLDARAPKASLNPEWADLFGRRPLIYVLTKADLAEPGHTEDWLKWFRAQGHEAVSWHLGQKPTHLIHAAQEAGAPVLAKLQEKGRNPRPLRAAVVGIPNVGKSTLINALLGKAKAKTGQKPGVTRANQWLKVGSLLELLDTPGVMLPRIEDDEVGVLLAAIHAVEERLYQVEEVAYLLAKHLYQVAPEALKERYGIETVESGEVLQEIGRRRGALRAGGVVDLEAAGRVLLKDLREGRLGRISLERAEETS